MARVLRIPPVQCQVTFEIASDDGSVYNHHDILQETKKFDVDQNSASRRGGDNPLPTLPTRVSYIAFARANPGLYRLMFGEGFRIASDGGHAVRVLRERAYDKTISSLHTRLPADEAKVAVLFLWSLAHGLALLMIDGQVDPGADPEALIRRVLRLAGGGVPPPA